MAVEWTRRLFDVGEYYRMAEAGVLGPDERVELIEGEIVRMNPIGPPHANCVNRTAALFIGRLGDRVEVTIQNPVRISDLTELEPDVALVRRDRDMRFHPAPADVFLIVEVAHTSLAFGRRMKLPLYARAGIPDVWIVDLGQAALETYRDPAPTGYATSSRLGSGDPLAVSSFPDVRFWVHEILGS